MAFSMVDLLFNKISKILKYRYKSNINILSISTVAISLILLGSYYLFPQSNRIEVKYENCTIIYTVQDENYAMIALDVLKENLGKYERFYDLRMERRISVILPATQMDYKQLIPGNIPSWSNALFIPHSFQIIIKKPDWYTGGHEFTKSLSHELSHAFFHEKFTEQSIPLWFNEGLAEYMSGEKINVSDGVIIANAIFTKNVSKLRDIDEMLVFSEARARLAYLQSYTAVLFLEDNLRSAKMEWADFFKLVNSHGFDRAIGILMNMDIIDFEIKWYKWLKSKYRWFIIFNWENAIWVIMGIILIGAMYAIRYRNRKILMKWDIEESENNQWETMSTYDPHLQDPYTGGS